MIVWSRLGFLALLIPMAIFLVIMGIDKSYPLGYVNEIGAAISAIAVWFTGKKLNSATSASKVMIDPETNKEVTFNNKHTIFFVPMEWFSLVWIASAIYNFSKHFIA
jgi:hypothetical protein